MNIKPFGYNILVKPVEKKQVLISERPSMCEYGTVVAIGGGVSHVKVGDIIGFTVFGINALEINDEKHYFIPESAEFILGTIEM